MPPIQKNMNMFNKDMIRTDDLFAPVSFGGGGGGGGGGGVTKQDVVCTIAGGVASVAASATGLGALGSSLIGGGVSLSCTAIDYDPSRAENDGINRSGEALGHSGDVDGRGGVNHLTY